MIGFSLKISKLKAQISRNLITEARGLGYPAATRCLKEALQGPTLSYSEQVTPWWSVSSLVAALEARSDGGSLLYNGGYPYLFTAKGHSLIAGIADVEGSRHEDLRDILDPDECYLVEAWDLS